METKTKEKAEDIKTAKEFNELFIKRIRGRLPAFEIYRPVEFRESLGYGASAIYLSDIPVPEMPEKEQQKKGLIIDAIRGMLWTESDINPNGITGKHDIGRTFTIHCEFKGLKRYTQRRWEDGVYIKFYGYGRTMESILRQFSKWLNGDFAQFKKKIDNKEYHWKNNK